MNKKELDRKDRTLPIMVITGTLFALDLCAMLGSMAVYPDKAMLIGVVGITLDYGISFAGIIAIMENIPNTTKK